MVYSESMQHIFFWILWFIISSWALRMFYFSFSAQKLRRLRDTAIGIIIGVLVLNFLPWVPPTMGQLSGIDLAFAGNWFIAAHIVVLLIVLVLFILNQKKYFKWAAALCLSALFILFTGLYMLRPATFILTSYDIASIVALLLLLINSVVVLLLWQQLQLLEKKSRKN